MNFIETLAAQRQKLLDGLDANDGDINLRIFEDFYPDEAHFIYELLQNAEDAGATEAKFELTAHSCSFEHNGPRHFDERDIRAITGIFNSSKKDNPDKIGKFGVGFKSVFVYTDTPVVFSRDYCFKIVKLVLPQLVSKKPGLDGLTRFEFPFNNPKKSLKNAYDEIKSGLEQLSETTLLFLNNLRYIGWKIGEQEGEVLREEHSDAHIEVLKVVAGKEILSSHWLRFSSPVQNIHRFSAPVDGVERQKISIAYELEFAGEFKSFDAQVPLAKQLKIKPSHKGKVAVFFPAEKETSGLRFHLHAPFIPELSRASIKNSPENAPLFEQLASLSAKSLQGVKNLGLLSAEFLGVLPNNDDQLPDRYRVIRTAILNDMQSQELVPSYQGGHAPARRLIQARASMKSLLSDDDLAFVLKRTDKPTWVIGATQKNSNVDRFLSSLAIPSWDADELKEFLEQKTCDTPYSWHPQKIDKSVIDWLSRQSSEWHQALYAILGKHCTDEDDHGSLSDAVIVRMADGTYRKAEGAYFSTGPINAKDPLPRIDESILSVGAKKSQQAEARRFLEDLGVKVPGEQEEIELLIKSRYSKDTTHPRDEVYLADLKRFIDFYEKTQSSDFFTKAYLFKVDSLRIAVAPGSKVFLDKPYLNSGLGVLYNSIKDPEKRRWPLSLWYEKCGIPLERLARFCKACDVEVEFKHLFVQCSCHGNPQRTYLYQAPGQRAGNMIDKDFELSQHALLLVQMKNEEASWLVWSAMNRVGNSLLFAKFQWTDRGGPRVADSQLVNSLKKYEWVPQVGVGFVKPRDAVQGLLPKGFSVDASYRWLQQVEFGAAEKEKATDNAARSQKRKDLGFSSDEEFEMAFFFAKQPKEVRDRFISSLSKDVEPVELPERQVRNTELRSQRVGEQAKQTPEKSSDQKMRAVPLGAEVAKSEAKIYLKDQYTNNHGQMVCQICKDVLPFKLMNGSYYFEAVEIIDGGKKRFREGYLCLCPNHAAAYQYANAKKEQMHELISTAVGSEVDVELGGVSTSIYFTEMHMADVKTCLATVEVDG